MNIAMNRSAHPLRKDVASILIGAVFISFSGNWVVWAQVDAMTSAFYRVCFGFIFLAVACAARKQLRPLSRRAAGCCLLTGLFFAGDLYCWHISIRYVGPGLATILGNFQVFVLTVVSLLCFGQPVRRLFLVSLPLAFFGLFLIVGIDWGSLSDQYRMGIGFGLLTALFYTGFILSLRRFQQANPELSFIYVLMLTSIATSLVLAPLMLASGVSFAIPTYRSMAALAGLALFSQTIGWSCITRSLPKLIPSVAGLILLLQPSLAFIWDVLLFGRDTSVLQWLGVAIVITAIYMGLRSTRR